MSQRPELLYDGICGLCRGTARFVAAIDWFRLIDRKPFQDPGVAERCAALGITVADLRRDIHLILPDGSVRRGFFAARRIAWLTPPLVLLAPLLYLPGLSVLGSRIYRFIADNRRRDGHT